MRCGRATMGSSKIVASRKGYASMCYNTLTNRKERASLRNETEPWKNRTDPHRNHLGICPGGHQIPVAGDWPVHCGRAPLLHCMDDPCSFRLPAGVSSLADRTASFSAVWPDRNRSLHRNDEPGTRVHRGE